MSPSVSVTIFCQKLDAQFPLTYFHISDPETHFLTDGTLKSPSPRWQCHEALITCTCADVVIDLHRAVTVVICVVGRTNDGFHSCL